jgi:hypothetical protein
MRGGGFLLSIDDNAGIYRLSQKYITDTPPNPKKGDTLELNEQQIAELKQKAVDEAVKTLKADHQAALNAKDQDVLTLKSDHEKLDKERDRKIKKFEEDAETRRQATIKATAESSFANLMAKGKILPAQKETYIASYISMAQSDAKVTLASGDEVTQAEAYEKSYSSLPDSVNLAELTKNIGKDKNSLSDPVAEFATEESAKKLADMYKLMDERGWKRDDPAKIILASAEIDRRNR